MAAQRGSVPAPGAEQTLKGIWRLGFGDASAFIDFFFRRQYDPDRCRCLPEGESPLTALHLIPFRLADGRAGDYIYAGATLPAARGRGLYRQLISAAAAEARDRGRVLFLHADPPLRPFYRSLGFTGQLDWARVRFDARGEAGPGELRLHSLTAAEYAPLRRARFPGPATVLWGERELAFGLDETRYWGGFACLAVWRELRGAIIGQVLGEELFLRETTFTAPELVRLAPVLCRALGGGSLTALLPPEEAPGAPREPAAMTLDFPAGPGWAGLTLD